MKIRRKIGDLGKDQVRQIVEDFLEDLGEGAVALLEYFEENNNPEFEAIEVDSEGRILSFTAKDGSHYAYNLRSETIDDIIKRVSSYGVINDAEDRLELTKDSEEKVISFRKPDGTLVENVGIEVPFLKVGNIEAKKAITNKKEIYVERPKFARINLYGGLPTDETEARTPTKMICEFIVDDVIKFCANSEVSIQGHGSSGYEKHNFNIDFINSEDESLSIKFGDMVSVDSFHLKGYYTDRTHARGIGSAAVWRALVKHLDFPYNIVNGLPFEHPINRKADSLFISDAKYSEDGFPLALYVNDVFHGLYSLKLKKNRKNYAMEKSVKREIFLDSITYTARLNEVFDHTDWELKNPKLSGYEEGGEITDAGVLANITRFFNFTSDIENQKAVASDYLNIPHWILYIIFCELVGQWDTDGNNTELCTWDGEHWSICPYDMDNTFLQLDNAFLMRGTFWATFRTVFLDEIQSMYTAFRQNGIINSVNLYQYFVNQVNSIPRAIYEADIDKWGYNTDAYTNIQFIYNVLQTRITYLDTVWLIQN